MNKEEIINELNKYKEYFNLVNLEPENLEFIEEFLLKEKLYAINTLIRNRERLIKENINI